MSASGLKPASRSEAEVRKIVMDNWRFAYRQANAAEPPECVYASGWFTIDGHKYRASQIRDLTATLLYRAETKK